MPRAEAETNYRQLLENWTHVRKQKAEIYKLTVHGSKATATTRRNCLRFIVGLIFGSLCALRASVAGRRS